MGEWHYEVKHGPDDQGDYSWVYASGVMVCVCKTKDAIEIVNACNRPATALNDEYDEDNLAPCPFCGGEAKRTDIEEEGENFGGSFISCNRCLASSNLEFGRKENFVGNWNRRVSSELTATLKEVVEVLEFYANPEIYKPHPHGLAFERRDKSDMARSLLAKLGGE